ncbi:hypothetical protein C7B82_16615 [Stenomitos frigidus ULC18]|uniref:Uncharacterized protein n=2 Tax=Stenomitos TaxID=1844270 RepID=A0A2T1E3N8_9CYAN|nr:hypothetical protein C7B82_16615 [Stenomitos frigidus ULC18]
MPTVTVSQLPQPSTSDPLAVYNAEQQKKEADQLKAQLEKQISDSEQLKAKVEKQGTDSDQFKALLESQSTDNKQIKAQLDKQSADFEQSKSQLDKQHIETEQLKSQLRNQQMIVESLTTQLKANTAELQNQNAQDLFGGRSTNYASGFVWLLAGVLTTIAGGFVLLRFLAISSQRQARLIRAARSQRRPLQPPKRYGKFLLPSQQAPEVHYEERRLR